MHDTWKSHLRKGLGRFDYAVVFHLPKEQVAACFGSLLHGFIVHGSVAKELRTIHFGEFLNFVDDVIYAYLDEGDVGLEVGDMISFLSGCPGLRYKSRTLTMFRLSCLCLEHISLNLPDVTFESPNSVGDGPDLV